MRADRFYTIVFICLVLLISIAVIFYLSYKMLH